MDGEPERTPPHDVLAERRVLGCMLLSREAAVAAAAILHPDDFYSLQHQDYFAAMTAVLEDNAEPDIALIKAQLEHSGKLGQCGGIAPLLEFAADVTSSMNAEHHAHRVLEMSQRRQIAKELSRIGEAAYQSGHQSQELRTEAADLVGRLDARHTNGTTWEDDIEEAHEWFERQQEAAAAGEQLGITTGIDPVDNLLGGLEPGSLFVLGGLSGSGKSAFGTAALVHHCCTEGEPAQYFAAEMAERQIILNMQRQIANVPYANLASERLTQAQLRRWLKAKDTLVKAPIHLVAESGIDIDDLSARATAAVEREDVSLVVVDYLQIIGCERGETKTLRVGEVGKRLKGLAARTGVPVLALSQITIREHGGIKLRWASELYHEADMVAYLLTDDEHEEAEQEGAKRVYRKVRIDKNRFGPQGIVELLFDKPRLCWEPWNNGEGADSGPRDVPNGETPF